jgi:hypothetical protein
MPTDPLLDLIDEHIAAIEAAVPQDLTKIAVGGPTLGLESLVSASMEGDPAPAKSPIDGGISDNTATVSAPSVETVRITMHEMIDGQISADAIAIDVDKATRAVSLAAVPADLVQIGLALAPRSLPSMATRRSPFWNTACRAARFYIGMSPSAKGQLACS